MPAIERISGRRNLPSASSSRRGIGAAARPGSRSSDRRTDYAAGSIVAAPVAARAGCATPASAARPPSPARVRTRSPPEASVVRGTSSTYSSAISRLDFARVISSASTRCERTAVAQQAGEARRPAGLDEAAERRAASEPGGQDRPVLCPRKDPGNRAKRAEEVWLPGRRAGRDPISRSASSSTGVKARKKSTKPAPRRRRPGSASCAEPRGRPASRSSRWRVAWAELPEIPRGVSRRAPLRDCGMRAPEGRT